jgi:acyl carrier protein
LRQRRQRRAGPFRRRPPEPENRRALNRLKIAPRGHRQRNHTLWNSNAALRSHAHLAIRAGTQREHRTGRPGPARGSARRTARRPKLRFSRELMMSSTFDTVANIIAETCDIPREKITPDSHAIDDLGIDSLDFLDIAFAIDKAFGIKLPLEQWTQEVNDGKATTEQYFVLKNLCARIDGLVAAKGA